ncbi:MAG TPA: heme lyase CcmF/NrfE family subunit [Acidobacteriota bacterium]|nr:heme lyase CcmF/NrfE family subunit [Acidobacteriota bacterium]
MIALGHSALIAAFATAAYTTAVALLGSRRRQPSLVASARNGVYVTSGLILLATGSLLWLIATDQFVVRYVAENSRIEQPFVYKMSALWGGMAGSLLLWTFVLCAYSTLAVWTNRRRHPELMPYVYAVCMVTAMFFIALQLFAADPFETLPFTPLDGRGMNPLLQNPAMAIHPPNLYLGYVGFTIPFAFAIAALASGRLDTSWLHAIRRWTIVAWFFLSIGITLGAQWAYVELGWGGYWGWDPVENASLMPWLVATAYLHSVMIEEKKQMLRVWNMLMVIATFALCIFGTFLTRSGIVSSVHAFTTSTLGPLFAIFLAIVLAVSLGLVAWRLPELRSTNQLESVLSRESSFLFNNLVLVVSCFAVLWGTMFPVISEAVNGVKITVGPPFFNRVNVPIFLMLLALTGVGPLIAWRRASWPSLRRAFVWPSVAGVGTMVVMVIMRLGGPYTLLSIGLSAFVVGTVVQEFWRGTRARSSANNESWPQALVGLTLRNKRRYGGYVIHVGIVLMAIGITGSSVFQREVEATLRPGETIDVGSYRLQYEELDHFQTSGVEVSSSSLIAFDGTRARFRMVPQRHFHPGQENPTTEVAIWSSLRHDLYIVLAGWDAQQTATFKAYLTPLVKWIWIGLGVLALGTILAMFPDRQHSQVGIPNY